MNTDRWAFLRHVPGAVLPDEPMARTKGRKHRSEARVKREVRAEVAERDQTCRLEGMAPKACQGRLEWMHLPPRRRSQTVGMPPEYRHTTQFTAMGCTEHHRMLDANVFGIHFIDADRGADGPIEVTR
jgi:hypothetical protein